jgi:integrase
MKARAMPQSPRTLQGLLTSTGRRKYLNAQERRRFIDAAHAHEDRSTRLLCLVLAFTGCRLSEALQLTSGSLLVGERAIVVRSLKKRVAGHVRMLPIPDTLLLELVAFGEHTPSADVLLWPWHRATAWRRIKPVMEAVGVNGPRACPRGLRHSFGVHAVASGVPITLLQRWLGHADLSTTAIYTHVLGPEERAFSQRMWQ